MVISVKNCVFSNNGAHGVYIQGDANITFENVIAENNGGHGMFHDQTLANLQALGLPENIDRKALAALLSELVNAPSDEKRKSILDPESNLMKGLKIGQVTAATIGSIVAVASNPAVQNFIAALLR